jgi:hypothetical protein
MGAEPKPYPHQKSTVCCVKAVKDQPVNVTPLTTGSAGLATSTSPSTSVAIVVGGTVEGGTVEDEGGGVETVRDAFAATLRGLISPISRLRTVA